MGNLLHQLIESERVDDLAKALSQGADPNEVGDGDFRCWAPLNVAIDAMADGKSVDPLIILLRGGANPNALAEGENLPPILTALLEGQLRAAELLLAAGADPDVREPEGDTPIGLCVQGGWLESARTILRCGAAKTISKRSGYCAARSDGDFRKARYWAVVCVR